MGTVRLFRKFKKLPKVQMKLPKVQMKLPPCKPKSPKLLSRFLKKK